jgi:flavin-dependent dehydrogenase
MNPKEIHIAGVGPWGLTAAINLAREGFKSIVYEKYSDVGIRFSGEFQGLENWSMIEI